MTTTRASTTTTAKPAPLPPLSRSQVDSAFARLTGSARRTAPVSVPAGYEAVTFDNHGNISFWHFANRVWAKAGTSTYPSGEQLGFSYPTFQVEVLDGMQHATFIANGEFSGDSSGNSVAYAYGSAGWGAIKARVNGHAVPGGGIAPSGEGVGYSQIGVEWQDHFVNGRLETADCDSAFDISNFSQADCELGESDRRFFRWTGSRFSLTKTILAWAPSFCLSPKAALNIVKREYPKTRISFSVPRGQSLSDLYLCEKGWAAVNYDVPLNGGGGWAATDVLQYHHDHWRLGDRNLACDDGSSSGAGAMSERLQAIGCGN